jgi:hypothetical protein
MKTPSNEAYLAAELMAAAIPKYKPRPTQAAHLASELCRIGRTWKRISERLCGGEEEWGPWSDHVASLQARAQTTRQRLFERAEKMLKESPFRATVESESLHLIVHSKVRGYTEGTALL